MAAAMKHKVGTILQLRSVLRRPEIRNFNSLSHPRTLSFSLTQDKQQNRYNFRDLNFNKNVLLFGSLSSGVNLASVRYNSTGEVPYIPAPPPIPSEVSESASQVSETVQALNSLGEPALSNYGLGTWSPVGIVQQLLEGIHCGLDIPWWASICVLTVFFRLLMFPVFIKSQRNSIHLYNISPELTRHQTRFTEAKNSKDTLAMALAHKDMINFMQEKKFSPFMFVYPLFQLPVFISVFWGLRGMTNAPVESFKDGGMLWFTDLTLPDPTWILPVCCSGLLLATFELGADGVRTESVGHTMKWFMRGMPMVFLPFMINFPSALLCYWVTSNTISMCFVGLIKIPAVRSFFKIPEREKRSKEVSSQYKKPFVAGFKENWENSKLQARLREKERMDAKIFKDAGSGPIPKTYSFDPTYGKPKPPPSEKGKWSIPFGKKRAAAK